MRRPSLRSQLNQIRLWVRQGRTDAWIAHKLDISVEQLRGFKKDQGLDGEPDAGSPPPADHASVSDMDEVPAGPIEPEDDIEAESLEPTDLEPEPIGGFPEISESERGDERPPDDRPEREADSGRDGEAERDERGAEPARRRRRGRRGGRRRSGKSAGSFEATFDHGEEGYGLWLDPAVAENDVYSEHWAGHRAVSVTVEPDAITIRRADRAGDDEPDAR